MNYSKLRREGIIVKILFLLTIILTQDFMSYGQQAGDPIPYRKGKLWGFCDSLKKPIVIPAYDSVDFFCTFKEKAPYSAKKIAIVIKNKKIGLINDKGRVLVGCLYDIIYPYWSMSEKRKVLLKKGSLYYTYSVDSGKVEKYDPTYRETADYGPLEDLKIDCEANSNNLKIDWQEVGILRARYHRHLGDNRYRWDTSYIKAQDFRKLSCSNQLLYKKVSTGWGLVTFSGRELFPPVYDSVFEVEWEHLFAAREKNKNWRLIIINASTVDPSKFPAFSFYDYEEIRTDIPGISYVAKRNNQWGLVSWDLQQDWMLDSKLYSKYISKGNGIVAVYNQSGRLHGYISLNGTKYWD